MSSRYESLKHYLLYDKRKQSNHTIMYVMLLEYLISLLFMAQMKSGRPYSDWMDFIVNSLSMLFLLMLTLVCITGRYGDRRQNFFFGTLLVVSYEGQFFGSLALAVISLPRYAAYLLFFESVGYFGFFFTWIMFWFYQNEVFSRKPLNSRIFIFFGSLLGFMLLLVIFNSFTHAAYYVDASGNMVYTRLCVVFTVFNLCFDVYYITIAFRSKKSRILRYSLLSYLFFPLLGMVVDSSMVYLEIPFNCDPYDNLCVTLSLYIVFFNIYSNQSRMLMKKEQELRESQINAMILQVNPHFIYNTLGSVESLCRSDPEKAAKLVSDFSDYLRGNYSNMTSDPMIPFESEMSHLKSYLSIEKVRFPNIEVLFDIKASDFELPCLTVQPLVENAIKHGVCKRRRSQGTIVVSSWEDAENYYIRVLDDGVGFTSYPTNDGKPHVGVANVRKRLEMLCDGRLVVNSVPGEGTISEILIPKTEEIK